MEAMEGFSDAQPESDLATGLRPFLERLLDVECPQPTSSLAGLLCAKGASLPFCQILHRSALPLHDDAPIL
jgi:hypothetical protein